jgi:exodeoxyribonuclease-3
MSRFIDSGFIDSYRHMYPQDVKYSWWSQRSSARKNNKGWRIDYFMVSKALQDNIADAGILNDAMHSDHCPVRLELDI